MLTIAEKVSSELTPAQKETLDEVKRILEAWDGRFNEESIEATVYSYAMLFFHKSLLNDYFDDEKVRLQIVDNHAFIDYFRRLIKAMESSIITTEQQSICKNAFSNYQGSNHCQYNLAMSFVKSFEFL